MKKRIGLLIIAFIIFYSLIHLGRYLPDLVRGRFSLVDERSYEIRFLNLAVDLLISFMFVFGTYCNLHRFNPNRKYLKLITSISISFLVCFTLQYLATKVLSQDPIIISRFFRNEILYDSFYVIFAMVFYFIQYSLYKELQQKELSLQNKTSELSLLRSQINPHFLFNNLNNIYSLVYQNSSHSLNAISGLSELLRFILYEQSEFIPLEKEVLYIRKYIELEQLRFKQPSMINFSFEIGNKNSLIPPFLLIPFVENAFKHGKVSFEDFWLEIDIKVESDGEIVLSCINNIGIKAKAPVGGIGLENVRKRLEILYYENFKFEIQQIENKFKVYLSIRD